MGESALAGVINNIKDRVKNTFANFFIIKFFSVKQKLNPMAVLEPACEFFICSWTHLFLWLTLISAEKN